MNLKSTTIFILLSLFFATSAFAGNNALLLIKKVIKANGGIKSLQALKDVSYEYTFRSMEKGIEDVSIERYIFNGEISYAQYTDRQYFVIPNMTGVHTQMFDGHETISKLDGKIITEQQPAYVGHFFRKTNFYWFNMMFKLADPGTHLKMMHERKVNGINYKVVEMTFGDKVGDTNDKYILYINPTTNRVDQFLFTVLGFGLKDPFLMKVEYEKIDNIYVSTYRKYAPADWKGNVIKEEWNEQITKNVKFNNGYTLVNIQDSFLEQSVSSSKKINMPAEKVWSLLNNMNRLNQLVPAVVEKTDVFGTGINARWTIYLKNGDLVKEIMTDFSNENKSMSYEMVDTPMPLKGYHANIKVKSINAQNSEVIFTTDFKVEEENRVALLSTFRTFQQTYLTNVPKLK